jgi:RNPHF zinc finger
LILFVLGCGLGHWHGHLWNNAKHSGHNASVSNDDAVERIWMTMNEGKRVLVDPSNPLATGGNGDRQQQDHDGWRVIHVFSGMSDHRDGDSVSTQSTHTEESLSAIATSIDVTDVERRRSLDAPDATQLHPTLHHPPLERPWHSQARQDELVVALLGNKTNGYFIDLAANDAVQLSNTYALERYYHWKGVCIEPNPMYWYNLTAFRTCVIIGAVVGDQRMQGNEASQCRPVVSHLYPVFRRLNRLFELARFFNQRFIFDSKRGIMVELRIMALTMASDGKVPVSVDGPFPCSKYCAIAPGRPRSLIT